MAKAKKRKTKVKKTRRVAAARRTKPKKGKRPTRKAVRKSKPAKRATKRATKRVAKRTSARKASKPVARKAAPAAAKKYKILMMGASYGSLLASKILFGGHSIHLVCLPAEADLINAEGFRVRMPVRGRKEPVELDSRKLPGKVTAGGAAGVNPADYDLVGLGMQEPQYRSPGVRELLDAVARSRVPCMSIMNMPPLPYIKRIPGLDYEPLKAAYTDADACGTISIPARSRCQPGSAGDPPAGRKRSTCCMVTLPTNFKCARFDSDKDTAILRQLEKDVDAARFDAPEGKIELPVKLHVLRFDLRAAGQVVDAARRQLPLHHQGRHAHRQGSGAHQSSRSRARSIISCSISA